MMDYKVKVSRGVVSSPQATTLWLPAVSLFTPFFAPLPIFVWMWSRTKSRLYATPVTSFKAQIGTFSLMLRVSVMLVPSSPSRFCSFRPCIPRHGHCLCFLPISLFFFPPFVLWLLGWGWFIWTSQRSLWESRHLRKHMETQDMETWIHTWAETHTHVRGGREGATAGIIQCVEWGRNSWMLSALTCIYICIRPIGIF